MKTSVHAGWQVSTCSGYDLRHPSYTQTHRQTAFHLKRIFCQNKTLTLALTRALFVLLPECAAMWLTSEKHSYFGEILTLYNDAFTTYESEGTQFSTAGVWAQIRPKIWARASRLWHADVTDVKFKPYVTSTLWIDVKMCLNKTEIVFPSYKKRRFPFALPDPISL